MTTTSATPEENLESFEAALTELSRVRQERDELAHERDEYKKAFELAKLAYERLRRQLFGAKSEHVDASQMALGFAELEKRLKAAEAPATSAPPAPKDPPKTKKKSTPHG